MVHPSIKIRFRAVAEVLVGAMFGMVLAFIPASVLLFLIDSSKDSESFMLAMLYAGSVGGCAVGIAFGRRRAAKA